ncbi:MAG: glucose-1-phosphate cytidylyltransferase [Gammaproteobacteria bacterium TMED34]|nr:MAG: glucose-1-phosphate cytidylyltransferase [Gammaproteobacteria bacterium TMED34]|tara:strand:+ start:3264 stop:3962 length:699 start_codon:yes stop_codon:yes gene_type:complete
MKVVILAGGFGTRLSEYTDSIPKPMVPIGNRPIIEHIMEIYAHHGHNEFYIALGYKGEVIKKHFQNFKKDWKINLIDTGADTFTGGRLKRLEKHLSDDNFLLTYGDGLSNININELIKFHEKHKKIVTISAVRPPARFGSLSLSGSDVTRFKEKTQLGESWINGGFFVINPRFFKFLKGDDTVLESSPLEKVTDLKEIKAFKHEGFWQCMDHKLDKDLLDKMIKDKKAPWIK